MDQASQPVLSGITFTGNFLNGVSVEGGSLPAGTTTWNFPGVVLWLNANVTVPAGSTLAIDAGQIIKLSGSSMIVQGSLQAQGTAANPVVFTSTKDDTAGGDTNNDGSASSPAVYDWGQIQFTSSSKNSVLNDAIVRYGSAYVNAEVEADGSSPTISNSVISESGNYGLRLVGSNATLTGDTFQGDGFYLDGPGAAIEMDVNSQPVITGITFSNNHINAALIDGGTLPAGTTTWNNTAAVYWLNGTVTVPATATLAIDAGQIIKLSNNLVVQGTLQAEGTAAAPIIFTSERDDSAGGDTNNDGSASSPAVYDWGQIQFTSTSTNSVLNYAIVRYGSDYVNAEVEADGSSPIISNSVISESGSYGLRLVGSSGTLLGDTFLDDGFHFDGPGAAIEMDAASQPIITGITLTDNNLEGAIVDGGTLSAGTTTWNPDIVYCLNGNVTVPTASALVIDPGQGIKRGENESGHSLIVQGSLQAQGTASAPIVFTSLLDNSAGGDTNNTGSARTPQPNDWSGIQFTSTSTANAMDHVEVRYGGQAGMDQLSAIEVDGVALSMTDCVVRDGVHAGLVALPGSAVTLVSDLFMQNQSGTALDFQAGSEATVVNNTIDGNLFGMILDGGTVTFVNNLVTNNSNTGIYERDPSKLTMSYNDVYNPGNLNGNYFGLTDPTGTNGNLSVDPQYFSAANLQYELIPGSPVEGAGTSVVSPGVPAPATDFFGNPPFKDPNITGRGDGSGYDMGAIWPQQTATSNIDLATLSVSAPATGTEGETVTVNWTVQEVGSGTATGSWSDAVYLSDTPVFSPDAQFLARVEHTGSLGPGQSYTASANVTLSQVLPGKEYILVRCNDLSDIFEGLATANNTASAPISFALPSLTLNTPYSDHFASAGQSNYYQLNVTGGQAVVFSLTSAASSGSTELYVSRGVLPSRSQFDYSGGSTLSPNQQIVVPTAQPGTYYILAYAAYGSSASSPYTITAQTTGFNISGVSPNTGGNAGSVTMDISGTDLSATAQANLVSPGGNVIAATATQFGNASQLYATFNLTGLATGVYGVQLKQAGQTVTESGAFTVGKGTPGHLSFQFNVPGATRSGQEGIITVDWVNDGGEDIAAPILDVQADNADLRFSDDTAYDGDTLEFLAINGSGPAGVLPPGATGSIQIPFIIDTDANSSNFELAEQMEMPLNWSAAEANLQPPDEPTAAWNAIYANFMADVGTTTASFQALLDKMATYLSQLGEYTGEEGRLMALEFQQAGDFGAIDQDYTSGAFGLGVPDPTNITATTDSSGDVTVEIGGEVRDFTLESNGSYEAAPGDTGVLTLSNGAYQIREADGTIEAFGTNGKLSYVEDTNGNRTSAVYSGSELTKFVDSDGETTTFTYNGQGLVTQITDPASETTDFTYDSAGQHLLSIADPSGTETFTYVSAPDAQTTNAISSITFPDGSQELFTYDSRGRLIETTANGGADAVKFTYDGAGGITATDALGESTTELVNEFGNPGLVEDALGNVTRYFYDADQNLIATIYPNGSISTTAYGAQNSSSFAPIAIEEGGSTTTSSSTSSAGPEYPTSSTDPLGNTTETSFDPALGELETLRDPNGNTLSFTSNAQGNTTAITFPDGTSQQYAYDAVGNVTQLIERNGQAINYTYNSDNLLTGETFSDGTSYQFTYDSHQNLISATDPTGTTMFAYDSADRLTKVTYPDGSFLKYTYNAAGQRSSMEDQTGFTVDYSYNSLGQLSELTDGNGDLIVSYTYDAVGRLSSEQFGNSTATDYTYDADSDVKSIVNLAPGGSVQSSYVYTYNSVGLPVSMTTASGTFTYGYDGDSELTSVRTPAGETISYQYDAAGNRIAVVDAGTTTQYTTNNLDEYTKVGNTTYQYNANGDLISQTDSTGTTTYSYNVLGELVGVVSPTAGTTTYQYDALGYMVSHTENGQVTTNLIDPTGLGNVVGQFNSAGGVLDHYTYGLGLTSQVTGAGTSNYYNFDLTGNTTQLTGPDGTVLNSYSYLPFGERLSTTGSAANPFTYEGQLGVVTASASLYLMQSRFYAPSLGRFTSPDPSVLGGGDVNLYRYVANQPTATVDPQGLSGVPAAGGAAAVAGASAGAPAGAAAPTVLTLGTIGNATKDGGLVGGAIYLEYLRENGDTLTNAQVIQDAKNNAQPAAEIGGFLVVGGTIASAAGAAEGASVVLLGFGALGGAAGIGVAGGTYIVVRQASRSAGELFIREAKFGRAGSIWEIHVKKELADCVKDKLSFDDCAQILKIAKVLGLAPQDPNDLSGPAGFGSQNFVPAGETFPYTIVFENEPTATAPAETVVVTEQLAANLNWSTFQLGNFGFGSYVVDVPEGQRFYSTRIDATATVGEYVDVTAGINLITGLVTWTFTSIDPTTGAAPTGLLAGFLPPDDSEGDGEGYVTYTVQPKPGLTTGTTISAQASVVFDTNAPLNTPTFVNTIDTGPPTSTVTALPEASPSSFTLSWSGEGDPGGSGIASYTIYVSDNGGPFTWLTTTSATSTTFTGQAGHTYGFYSVANDNVGNIQPTPAAAQATTLVAGPPTSTPVNPLPATTLTPSFTVTWSGSPGTGASSIASYEIFVSEDGGPFTSFLSKTIQTSATFSAQAGHTYGFYSVATDNLGDIQPSAGRRLRG